MAAAEKASTESKLKALAPPVLAVAAALAALTLRGVGEEAAVPSSKVELRAALALTAACKSAADEKEAEGEIAEWDSVVVAVVESAAADVDVAAVRASRTRERSCQATPPSVVSPSGGSRLKLVSSCADDSSVASPACESGEVIVSDLPCWCA